MSSDYEDGFNVALLTFKETLIEELSIQSSLPDVEDLYEQGKKVGRVGMIKELIGGLKLVELIDLFDLEQKVKAATTDKEIQEIVENSIAQVSEAE